MPEALVAIRHRIVVWGPPRTKKSHNVMALAGGRHILLPSKAWTRWVKGALIVGRDASGKNRPAPVRLAEDFNCRALFYRDADRGDLVGYMQGLADLLEKRGVIMNDRQLVGWDGSRLLKDAAHPRVELVLEPIDG